MPQASASLLPPQFRQWFKRRGWKPREHQLQLLAKAQAGRSVLLVAPTGAGKTLAGFLPSLTELVERKAEPKKVSRKKELVAVGSPVNVPGSDVPALPAKPRQRQGSLHTLYISPLKALATDIARNLESPVAEMNLPIRVETRTGDTPAHKRARQIERPPDILLTTPEQLALLLAHREARDLFKDLRRVVLDELHSLVTSKRGDLLSLDLARLFSIAPQMTTIGLSATVREPDELRRYLVPQSSSTPQTETASVDSLADLVVVQGGAQPDISMLDIKQRLPLAGHTAYRSMPAIYDLIRKHKTTLIFVNTRLQAEYTFRELWDLNDDNLPIALHHGSLDVSQRRRVEEAMIAGKLRGIVCTATLDMGIDWGDVDLVVNVGAPKGASRIMQRIGRSNHRMDEPSKAYLVPANSFEILECQAALDAVHEAAQDTPDARIGALDVLCQHILGMACAEPFDLGALYDEITSAAPYAALTWEEYEACVAFVATGGYALRAYERFAKIVKGKDGLWRVRDARIAQQYRMNVGTIMDSTTIKVRLGRSTRSRPGTVLPRGRVLGEVEEYFAETLTPGDTFLFAGEVLRFEGISEDEALVTKAASGTDPKIPAYDGGKFPLSTFLAARVRAILADPFEWDRLPGELNEWLLQQRRRSVLPGARDLLVETFPRGGRYYMTCFPFEGRLSHQTLGMLLTRRLERAGLKPLGFVANDYGLAIWANGDIAAKVGRDPDFMDELFSEDMLGDDMEEWLAESALMKRTFRFCAVIAGLIERRFPGQEKTGRQVTVSTDLIYDVLRKHEPDHVLLRAARADAATGLLDVKRLGMMLERIRGRIIHKPLDRVSPLSVSVMLEIGRERVYSDDADDILAEAEATLLDEALA